MIGKQAKSFREQAEKSPFLSSSLNARLKGFNKEFEGQEEANAIGLMSQDAMTELRQERINDFSSDYLNEQRGMSTILLNSLAGGLSYREPRLEKVGGER